MKIPLYVRQLIGMFLLAAGLAFIFRSVVWFRLGRPYMLTSIVAVMLWGVGLALYRIGG